MGAGTFDPIKTGKEAGSTWLVVSGPRGSKVTETFGTEAEAQHYVGVMTARGVDAEVRELVQLAYPVMLRIDVERSGCRDGALLCTLIAKTMLREADNVLNAALVANAEGPAAAEEAPEPKIVVPTLTLRKGRRG